MCSLNILCASLFTQAFSPRLQLHALFLPDDSLSTHVFSFSFVWVIYSVRYGLLNSPQFLFSYAHMKISKEKKEGLWTG